MTPKAHIKTADYEGDDRREQCSSCVKDEFNRMQGRETVKTWIIYVVAAAALGGSFWQVSVVKESSAMGDEVKRQVVINTTVIAELRNLSQQNIEEHRRFADARAYETKQILDAISKIRR